MLNNRFAFVLTSPLTFPLTFPLLGLLGCGDPVAEEMITPPPPPPIEEEKKPMELLPRCELPYDVRAIDKVSTGAVNLISSPTDPLVYTAEVDATAGGSMKFGENPFVYVDLIERKKVEISDAAAQKSKDWDIALKRWQIKVNSGDSGPGYVLLTRVPAMTLDEVTAAPTGPYLIDAYFDAKCKFIGDPIGGLSTALSDWYEYEMVMGGGMRLVPRKEVYVIKRRDGMGHIKLQLTGYYKGTVSGNYTMQWSYLP
jgi:hypothetical protein